MPRPDKVQVVEEIKERFEGASAAFITEYRSIPVARQQALRSSVQSAGGRYKVLKMSLTRRALDEMGVEGLDEWLTGPTAVTFTDGDPVPVARALSDFAKEFDTFVIKGGWFNGEAISDEVVTKLATIESREVLLAKIAGAAKGPLSKLALMLGSMSREAASLFSALLERKESESGMSGADVAEAEAEAPAEAEQPDSALAEPEPSSADASDNEAPSEDEADDPDADQADEAGSGEATPDTEAGDTATTDADEAPEEEAQDSADDDKQSAEPVVADDSDDDAEDTKEESASAEN